MKRFSADGGLPEDGFTLIELLAVITIILLLAGLILGIAGNAQFKAAQSRAQGEIQAYSTAIGNYQIDNGVYPGAGNTPPSVTDKLDARTMTDPKDYTDSGKYLFQVLCGAYYLSNRVPVLWTSGNADNAPRPTAYYTFKDNQLKYSATGTSDPDKVSYIADPFGFSYGYSTAYSADLLADPTKVPTHGYNPTFDLWSTAGYSDSQGKGLPRNMTSANASTLWIKNW